MIIALFATGLKLDRALARGAWAGVGRLLIVAMPLTIAAVALFGTQVMGLSLGAAIILGAVLAPTDPVLAGDIGVGPPGDEDEHEPNFSITGEAGLNDGLAFPFLFARPLHAGQGGTGWVGEWLLADVLYAVGRRRRDRRRGSATALAALAVRLRDRDLLSPTLRRLARDPGRAGHLRADRVVGAYGFIAAFAGGARLPPLRAHPRVQPRVHEGAEVVEKFGELARHPAARHACSRSPASQAPGWPAGCSSRRCCW